MNILFKLMQEILDPKLAVFTAKNRIFVGFELRFKTFIGEYFDFIAIYSLNFFRIVHVLKYK